MGIPTILLAQYGTEINLIKQNEKKSTIILEERRIRYYRQRNCQSKPKYSGSGTCNKLLTIWNYYN